MAEKKPQLKTTIMGGKGGSIISLQPKRGLFYFITSVLIFSLGFQPVALASGRSNAGGGDIVKPNFGKVASSIGIGMGMMAIGSALSSAVSAAQPASNTTGFIGKSIEGLTNLPKAIGTLVTNPGPSLTAMTNSLGGSFALTSLATNYSTFVATSQVSRAVGMAGAYYGWKPSRTFLLSSFATGTTAGLINPAVVLGDAVPAGAGPNMIAGAFVGGLTSLASSGAMVAIDGKSINQGKEPGVAAQVGGMFAGAFTGNLARSLVNPLTYSEAPKATYKRTENPEIGKEIDLAAKEDLGKPWYYQTDSNEPLEIKNKDNIFTETQSSVHLKKAIELGNTEPSKYQEVLSKNPITGKEELGNMLSADKVVDSYGGKEAVRFDRIAGDYLRAVKISNITSSDIATNIFNAGFVRTLDMWPQLTARSLSMAMTKSSKSNNQLMNTVVEGFASAAIGKVAEALALKPSLYIGNDRISNSILFQDNMLQALYRNHLNPKMTQLHALYRGAEKDNLSPVEFKELLVNNGFTIPADTILDKAAYIEKTKENMLAQHKSSAEITEEITRLENEKLEPKQIMVGIARDNELAKAEGEIKGYIQQGLSPDVISSKLGVNTKQLFLNSAWNEIKFSLLEGAINGGINSLLSKSAKNNPLTASLTAYGATMLSGTVRGIVRYAAYDDSEWMPNLREFAPTPLVGKDIIQESVDKKINIDQAERFKRYGRLTGLQTEVLTGPDKDKTDVTAYKPLVASKPSLSGSILFSLSQANNEFTQRAFSFGSPYAPAKNVDSLMLTDYLNNIRSYGASAGSPGWLSSALTSGYINAGSSATSHNILSSLASVKGAANYFNIQQERMVKTNSPLLPYLIQSKEYRTWAADIKTRWNLEDDYPRTVSGSGKSFLKN